MRVRTKVIPYAKVKVGENIFPFQSMTPSAVYFDWRPNTMRSETCSDGTAPGPPYKWVNPLSITKMYHPAYMANGVYGEHWVSGGGPYQLWYKGLHWVSFGTPTPILLGGSSTYNSMSMNALGATGWKKFQPAKPIADLGTFLGESRELPRQFSDAVKALRELATSPSKTVRNMSWLSNQHLATQFGWLPLMRDLEDFHKAYKDTNSWLDRVRKYNGEWEHRGGVVAKDEVEEVVGQVSITPLPTSYSAPPEGVTKGNVYVVSGYRVWFSAWFKYYIEDFDSPSTQLRLKARIWGLSNTPAIVWNLLPWSWMVDWFSNLGDNIDNLAPIDNLVAKMPCVMRHCYTYKRATVTQRYKDPDGTFRTITASNEANIETKGRAVASPFGFGVSDGNLSARQLSILAALGIQRVS